MAGHSRSKNGVALLAYVPAISLSDARCPTKRDRRDKPGDDELNDNRALARWVQIKKGPLAGPVCIRWRIHAAV